MNARAYLVALVCMLLSACSSLGLPTPQTFNERIAAAQVSVTQVRVTAKNLLVAGSIGVDEAEKVLGMTDLAAEAIAVARGVSATNPQAADAKLKAAILTLTALQTYLAEKVKQ